MTAAVGLVLLSVTLAGCSEAWPVGVTLRDGQVVAVFPSCDNQLVTGVNLELQEPTRKVLWEIRSDAGSRQTDYVVGEAPPGFVTVVPLTEPLPSGVLFLHIEATETVELIYDAFRLSDLAEGQIHMGSKNGDYERLRREADINGMCGTGSWFEGGRKTGYLKVGAGVLVIAVLASVAIYVNHRRTHRSSPW